MERCRESPSGASCHTFAKIKPFGVVSFCLWSQPIYLLIALLEFFSLVGTRDTMVFKHSTSIQYYEGVNSSFLMRGDYQHQL